MNSLNSEAYLASANVGSLKKNAFELGKGDFFAGHEMLDDFPSACAGQGANPRSGVRYAGGRRGNRNAR